MTNIRNAQGNNLTEVMSDTINQVVGQFGEGINAMFSGFKTFSSNFGVQGFAPNGQQQSSHLINTGESTSIAFKDAIIAGKQSARRRMDAEIPFGPEDLRAIGGN